MPAGRWSVLVVDDEPAARRGVRQLLGAYPEFRVVGECRNGRELLAALDTVAVDAVFLDIQMPGMDGFEVIRRRSPERMPAVVFLTAFDEHALKAFDAQALDYLVKPVTEARFATMVRRLTRQLRGGAVASREPSIVVHTSRGSLVIALHEVEWIESADNYCRLWVAGRGHLHREALSTLEQRITAHGFARAHRQALVRLGAVRELHRGGETGCLAILKSGTRVPVSRRRRAAFSRALGAAG